MALWGCAPRGKGVSKSPSSLYQSFDAVLLIAVIVNAIASLQSSLLPLSPLSALSPSLSSRPIQSTCSYFLSSFFFSWFFFLRLFSRFDPNLICSSILMRIFFSLYQQPERHQISLMEGSQRIALCCVTFYFGLGISILVFGICFGIWYLYGTYFVLFT